MIWYGVRSADLSAQCWVTRQEDNEPPADVALTATREAAHVLCRILNRYENLLRKGNLSDGPVRMVELIALAVCANDSPKCPTPCVVCLKEARAAIEAIEAAGYVIAQRASRLTGVGEPPGAQMRRASHPAFKGPEDPDGSVP